MRIERPGSGWVLYHYWRSSASWRVRWGLAYKGIEPEMVAVDLLKGEHLEESYRRHQPMGTVPSLVVGGHAIGESLAILEWLEETFPKPSLLPSDPLERAWVRQLCLTVVAGTHPLQNLGVLRHLSADESLRQQWASHWILRGLQACERMLAGKGQGFCLGDRLTLADLCLVPQIYNAHRFSVSLDALPHCRRIYEHCLTVESCAASAPDKWKPA